MSARLRTRRLAVALLALVLAGLACFGLFRLATNSSTKRRLQGELAARQSAGALPAPEPVSSQVQAAPEPAVTPVPSPAPSALPILAVEPEIYWLRYGSVSQGLSFKYPPGWNVAESAGSITIVPAAAPGQPAALRATIELGSSASSAQDESRTAAGTPLGYQPSGSVSAATILASSVPIRTYRFSEPAGEVLLAYWGGPSGLRYRMAVGPIPSRGPVPLSVFGTILGTVQVRP